ncbi:hypothetical protein Tco_0740388 [Tanacetum coccineum]
MGKAIVKLVKKVKKLENILNRRKVVLTASEDEEPKDQGRIFKGIKKMIPSSLLLRLNPSERPGRRNQQPYNPGSSLKATKAELKRICEELQTKTTKRQKIDDKDA